MTAAQILVGPDLADLPGVPESVSGLACPECGKREATVWHKATGDGMYSATLICGGCGSAYELGTTAYTTGLSVGVIAERFRRWPVTEPPVIGWGIIPDLPQMAYLADEYRPFVVADGWVADWERRYAGQPAVPPAALPVPVLPSPVIPQPAPVTAAADRDLQVRQAADEAQQAAQDRFNALHDAQDAAEAAAAGEPAPEMPFACTEHEHGCPEGAHPAETAVIPVTESLTTTMPAISDKEAGE